MSDPQSKDETVGDIVLPPSRHPPATVGEVKIAAVTDPPLPAKTTSQEDMTSAGQRHINVMWERTQQVIAILVTATTLVVCSVIVAMRKDDLSQSAFMLLSNVFFLVVGTYFQRTNHTKTGGVAAGDTGR